MIIRKSRRGISTSTVIILLVLIIPLAYFGIVYYSVNSATLSIENPSLDIGLTDILSIESISEILLSRQMSGEFDLVIEGNGFVSTTIKNLQAEIYLEDVYIGEISSDRSYVIPASGITRARMNFMVDMSEFSLPQLEIVANSIAAHNGEVEFGIAGYYEPIIVVVPITLEFASNSYMYTYSDAPKVTQLQWDTSECEVGDYVDFTVTVENVFRAADIEGFVDVFVKEDIPWGADSVADSYRFPISLSSGQTDRLEGSFDTYLDDNIDGFFLKAQWGQSSIGEQSDSYPPRLTVTEGELQVVNYYWTKNGQTVSSCSESESIKAHVLVRAIGGPVQGSVTAQIRKDIGLLPDEGHYQSVYSINLESGDSYEIVIPFTSESSFGPLLRGYFVELSGGFGWTMENGYPPRLETEEASWFEPDEPTTPEEPSTPSEPEVQQGYPVVTTAYWKKGGAQVFSCGVGDQVTAVVSIKSISGYSDGIITVRIREDIPLLPDTDFEVQSYLVDLEDGQSGNIELTFYPERKSGFGFRGYFIEVDFDSWSDNWTMDSDYPPRLEVD